MAHEAATRMAGKTKPRGHMRATNDQIAANNSGHSRKGISPAHR
jgi:hypothetical protein